MTRVRWLRITTAVALGLCGVALIIVSSSIRHDATAANARTAKLSPTVSADRHKLRTTARANTLLAARLTSTHKMVVRLQQARDLAQLQAFREAHQAARNTTYPEAYQAAFPVDLNGSNEWYVVRVTTGSGYETTSWSAPQGSEYVINGGTVTPYALGTAPSPYVQTAPIYTAPIYTTPTYTAPIYTAPNPACSESGSCYGDISPATGRPKTIYVPGYYRSDGTYVRGYYRS